VYKLQVQLFYTGRQKASQCKNVTSRTRLWPVLRGEGDRGKLRWHHLIDDSP